MMKENRTDHHVLLPIMYHMRWVVFAGHGDQVHSKGADKNGFNKAIVPADYNGKRSSLIIDDVMFAEVSVDLSRSWCEFFFMRKNMIAFFAGENCARYQALSWFVSTLHLSTLHS